MYKDVEHAIDYIEQHLAEELTLHKVSREVGISKYHFHRLFKEKTGLSIGQYIRTRKLARAAFLLLETDFSILEIALECSFETQESFTRAFKSIYQLPPGKYRNLMKNMIRSEEKMNSQEIKGWLFTGTAPEKYEITLDRKVFNLGTKSASIASKLEEYQEGEFATLMQQFDAKKFIGKRVRFSAFVKAEEVKGWAGLWMRMDSVGGAALSFDNMQDRPICGTEGWNYYDVVLEVPDAAVVINIGILLSGKGKVWMDHAEFQEVERSIPTTDGSLAHALSKEPQNLDFEEG